MSDHVIAPPRSSANSDHAPHQPNRQSPSGAVVLGGNYRALGLVRSLGRHGVPVWVLTDEHTLAGYSRYARQKAALPQEAAQQLEFLKRLCEQNSLEGWALFPTSDKDVGLVARNHAALAQQFRLTVPPWDTLRWAYDKRLTYQLAEQLGVGYPATCYPRDREEVAALDVRYPAVLKPAIKQGFNAFVHAKAWQVNDRQELLYRYEEASALVPPEIIMVQELIPGDGRTQLSYAALCADGHPHVSLVARRTRQYPIDFGRSSTFVETVDEPDVEGMARPLLAALHYTGLMEIEFKRDPRTGQLKLLDMNPRVWGWHTLGRRFGGDFPYLYWRWLHGETMPKVCVPPGVHWIRWATDTLAVLSEFSHSRLTVREYARSLSPPMEHAILAHDDPLPSIIEIGLLARVALRRKAM